MVENRGRPSENTVKPNKWVLETGNMTYYYDVKKNPNGCWKSVNNDTTKYPKPKIDQRPYGKSPVVMVFKTSNRSNAKTKMKIYNMIEIIKHVTGFCGEHWHPNMWTALAGSPVTY